MTSPIREEALEWAVSRWNAEVKHRPLQNIHRRSLDDTWRRVIRYFGGDDESLCGPRHDDESEPEPTPEQIAATSGGVPRQQLVARIKRSSKYTHQAPKGGWFDVRVVPDMGYGLRGNNNSYRFSDVVFGVRLDDGTVVELK